MSSFLLLLFRLNTSLTYRKDLDQIAPQVEPFQKWPASSVVCRPLRYWSKSSAENFVPKSEWKNNLQVPLEQFLHGAIRHVARPGCVFRFVSSIQVPKVSMSQVQVNRKELQKAGYRVLQEMRVDVKPLWCVKAAFSRDNKNNLGMTPATYFKYRWCTFVHFTHGTCMHFHPFHRISGHFWDPYPMWSSRWTSSDLS